MKFGLLAVFTLVVALIGTPVYAQFYEPMGPGSKYICGYFGDRTNKILTEKKKAQFFVVSYADASKDVATQLKDARSRTRALRAIQADLIANRELSKAQNKKLLQSLKKFVDIKGEQVIVPEPPNEKLLAITSVLVKAEAEEKRKTSELAALKKCNQNKRPKRELKTVTTIVRYFDGSRRLYGALFLTSAKSGQFGLLDYPQRWLCIRAGIAEQARPLLFSGNPCYNFVELGDECSNLVPKGQLGAILVRITAPYQSPEVTQGNLQEMMEIYGGGTSARVRGDTGSIFDPAVEQDDCSEF